MDEFYTPAHYESNTVAVLPILAGVGDDGVSGPRAVGSLAHRWRAGVAQQFVPARSITGGGAMGIRENLAALMAHRGISQNALAKAAGVPQPTIQRIVRGESADPKTPTVAKLARYFGVSVEELRGTKSGLVFHGESVGLSAEAVEIAHIWMGLPEARRRSVRETLFIMAVSLKIMPWLFTGRPTRESYEEYERRAAQLARERGILGAD